MPVYLRPAGLEEALAALAEPHTVLAGGTDFYPARVGRAIDENVLDITGIAGLGGIAATAKGKSLLEAGRARRLAALTRQIDALSGEERRALQRAADILGRLNRDG